MYRAPHVVEEVIDADGYVVHETQREPRRVLGAETAAQMRRMMATVFEGGKDAGTAATIVVPGFKCAGKTGTAHKWYADAKQYALHRYLSSFAGLAPLDGSKLAIVVFVDEPSGGDYYGGKVAGPVFAKIASESLRYLGMPGETLICPPPTPPNPWAVTPARTCTTPSPRDAILRR
jgi:cell division protein FtsI (penicillin-binding protein 3)